MKFGSKGGTDKKNYFIHVGFGFELNVDLCEKSMPNILNHTTEPSSFQFIAMLSLLSISESAEGIARGPDTAHYSATKSDKFALLSELSLFVFKCKTHGMHFYQS